MNKLPHPVALNNKTFPLQNWIFLTGTNPLSDRGLIQKGQELDLGNKVL